MLGEDDDRPLDLVREEFRAALCRGGEDAEQARRGYAWGFMLMLLFVVGLYPYAKLLGH